MRYKIGVFILACVVLLLAGCAISGRADTEPNDSQAQAPSAMPGVTESQHGDTRQTLTFLYFSDTQPDPEIGDFSGFGMLLAKAVNQVTTPELIIFGGDTVNDGGDEAEWEAFKSAAGQSLNDSVTAAVAGNHDSYDLLAEQFDYPVSAPEMPGGGFFYTFQCGGAFFVMLDSNIMGAANQTDIEWMRNELQSDAAQQADWIIAVMHHPMWPVVDNPKDIQRAETMRENFLPLLEANGVDLILCGHQHVYARTVPMLGDMAADSGRGIVQIMVASGDKTSYTAGERDFLAAVGETPGYLLISVDEERLSVTAYSAEQTVIDELIIDNS